MGIRGAGGGGGAGCAASSGPPHLLAPPGAGSWVGNGSPPPPTPSGVGGWAEFSLQQLPTPGGSWLERLPPTTGLGPPVSGTPSVLAGRSLRPQGVKGGPLPLTLLQRQLFPTRHYRDFFMALFVKVSIKTHLQPGTIANFSKIVCSPCFVCFGLFPKKNVIVLLTPSTATLSTLCSMETQAAIQKHRLKQIRSDHIKVTWNGF